MEAAIYGKSYAFAIRMVTAYQYLTESKKEYIISKQLLRSGTAIGAIVREAKFAQGPKDFVSKLSQALKEANETTYWLNLLHDTGYISEAVFLSATEDCKELIAILVSSIVTSKRNQNTLEREQQKEGANTPSSDTK